MAMAVATATAHAADQWSRGGVPSPPPPDQLAQARDSDSGSHVGSAVTRRMRNRPVSAGAPGGAHSGHLGEARRQLGRRVARRSPYMTGARPPVESAANPKSLRLPVGGFRQECETSEGELAQGPTRDKRDRARGQSSPARLGKQPMPTLPRNPAEIMKTCTDTRSGGVADRERRALVMVQRCDSARSSCLADMVLQGVQAARIMCGVWTPALCVVVRCGLLGATACRTTRSSFSASASPLRSFAPSTRRGASGESERTLPHQPRPTRIVTPRAAKVNKNPFCASGGTSIPGA